MSTRNCRNRRNCRASTPSTPPNQNQRPEIVFSPKLKYANSSRTRDGVLVVSSRKRAATTSEEIEAKKQRKIQIQVKQVALSSLRHKIICIWEHGINTQDFRFGPKENVQIISFLQATVAKYANRSAAASFVYRTISKHRRSGETPHLCPFRDRRGENRRSPKRKNAQIVTLCDELLSEPKATAPKIRQRLAQLGHVVSDATIHRIARDLCFRWTKPWYTDVLTPAQKLKRKIFCRELLRLTPAQLLNRIGGWLWTDEKWWDIVGPGSSRYIKALSQIERKLQNQVNILINLFFCFRVYVHE